MRSKEVVKSIVQGKLKDILMFSLAGFKSVFVSLTMGLFALITLAIVGSIISGDWTVGTSFNEWWGSMASMPAVNGKFSAVDPKTCFVCGLFAKCFDLMSVMGLRMYIYIADIAWTLITMGFAVWILIYMYDHIIKEQDGDVYKMVADIAKRIIIISIVGAGLFFVNDKDRNEKYLQYISNTIVDNTAVPVLKMGVGVSAEILDTQICSKLDYPKSEVKGMLSDDLKKDMLCLLNSVSSVYLSAMTTGSNMVSMSWKSFIKDISKNAKNLPDIVAGMALIAIFLIMYVTIPFILIDMVFTLGILLSFLPLMIGGYAYDRTKNFSSTGIKSLWGMCFYIIMYSVFLGIIYSSFVFIADMYYPGPLDNFTYLFPDFMYNNMVGSQTANIMKNQTFANCYNSAGGEISKIQNCLLKIGIDFEMPSIENPGGSFLPMFTFGLLSLMIMGSAKKYADLLKGYTFEIGGAAMKFLQSSWKWAKSNIVREISGFRKDIMENNLEKLELDKQSDDVIEEAKDTEDTDE
ncbi:MAG: type IV secretion system protein [Alphaproteobacteria bacterium]|nr:type IV secretion system protein [Alphaproteobacteria bacterium]